MSSIKSGYYFIASTIAYYVIERWLNFLESIIPDFIPYLNFIDIIFIILAVVGIYLIVRDKLKKEPLTEEHKHLITSKIYHSHNLKKLYERIVSIKTELNQEGHLIFVVPPIQMYDPNESVPLEEKRRRILEYNDDLNGMWTSLSVMIDIKYALQHLEYKEYKKINKKLKKSNKLLEKYNKNNNDKIRIEINKTLQIFRQELLILIDRLNNDHIIKGGCGICP